MNGTATAIVSGMLHGLAGGLRKGADEMDAEPVTRGAIYATSSILELVGDLLKDRTVEEATAILERVLREGAKPISAAELDAQVDEVLKR